MILLLPLFFTLKNEENGLSKNCYTKNRKHCATVQVWGVVEPQWILLGLIYFKKYFRYIVYFV